LAPSRYRSHPPSSPISCFGPRGAETAALGIRPAAPIGGTIVGPAITYRAPTGACHDHDTLHDNRWRCALRDTVSKGSGVPCTHVRGMARSVPPTSAIDTGHRQGSGHECRYRSGASSGSKLKFLVRPSPAQVRPLQLQQARAHTSNHAATTCAWCAFELMAGNPGCFI
jgi:hypothetical protein